VAAWPLFAAAEDAKIPVIGFLSTGSPRAFSTFVDAFHQGLREQGYVEGRDVFIEHRWVEGQYDQLAAMAKDLVGRRVAVIAATGGLISAKAAIEATKTVRIPVVFVVGPDPVRLGLVATISRPGGNATGASLFSLELATKRMEMLKQALTLKGGGDITFALVVNPGSITTDIEIADTKKAAEQINRITERSKIDVKVFRASTENEIEAEISSATEARATALLFSADPFFMARRKQIVTLAARHRIPAMYPWREYVKDGGLMSYGTELTWGYHLIGGYAARILKGGKPQDLPVELPSRFELAVNLKTASALGIKLNPDIVAVAEEVIE